MGILWCGGEDIDFPSGDIPAMSTTTAYFRSSYARACINYQNKYGCRSKPFEGGAVTSCWLSFHQYGGYSDGRKVGIIKESTGSSLKGIYVGFSAISGNYLRLAIYKWDGTTQTKIAEETGYSCQQNAVVQIDMQITSYGASANVKVYYAGQQNPVIDYSGDISISGVPDLDAVALAWHGNYTSNYSEIIVADEDTRTFSLVTLAPNAAGSTNQWSGAYTDVDEVSYNDADVVYTNTVDYIFQCNLTGMPSGSFSIKAVKDIVRACKTADATPTGIKLGVRTNGSDNHGSAKTLNTAWDSYERLMNQNPVTVDVWTQAEIDVLQHSQQAA